ncbi:MAG TPA: hypothetical protein VG186_05560 [Solirubrobacteraceae bacterium]|jgi:hypothetical protein|nr:hypothetical protein [Solirubrobacteraceae bacterium]
MGIPDPYSGALPPARHHERRSQHQGDAASPLESVLETECMALLALEATRTRIRFLPGEHDRAEADIGGAIELLRHAIAELRPRQGESSRSLLALGFVARHEDL